MATGSDIFLAFLALLFPPLPVWVKCGKYHPVSTLCAQRTNVTQVSAAPPPSSTSPSACSVSFPVSSTPGTSSSPPPTPTTSTSPLARTLNQPRLLDHNHDARTITYATSTSTKLVVSRNHRMDTHEERRVDSKDTVRRCRRMARLAARNHSRSLRRINRIRLLRREVKRRRRMRLRSRGTIRCRGLER